MANWAICIGINQYDDLQPLKYAVRDAERMKDWLINKAGFPESQVYYFSDNAPSITDASVTFEAKPTYAALYRFLNRRFKKRFLQSGDNLWFFFSGHGSRYQERDYLMFSDSSSENAEIQQTAISTNFIVERLRRCGADNVMLFVDACREGNKSGRGIELEKEQGVITIASCSPNEFSYEIDALEHGSFTYALLESLDFQGENNCATIERLNRRLRNRVREINNYYRKGRQTPRTVIEPASKYHLILLPDYIRPTANDIAVLKTDALTAEVEGNLKLARSLWRRLIRFETEQALVSLERIWAKSEKQGTVTKIESETVPDNSGSKSVNEDYSELSAFEFTEEQHQQNLEQYRQSFFQTVEQEFPLSEPNLLQLRNLQQSLQLTDEEVSQIEQAIVTEKETEARKQLAEQQLKQKEYEKKLERYKQEFLRAIQGSYPLDQYVRNGLKTFQQSLELSDGDVERIENPILDHKKAEYKKQQEEDRIRRRREEVELQRQQQEVENKQEVAKSVSKSVVTPSIPLQVFKFEVVKVNNKGQKIKREKGQAQYFTEDLGNGITLDMVYISGDTFMMGSPEGEGYDSEKPQHEVVVQPFFMGKFQVTQAQWREIASKDDLKVEIDLDPDPSKFKGDDLPVERVNWYEAVEFCQRLSKLTGRDYRLPSEAEWEYACRARTTTPFHFGETISPKLARCKANLGGILLGIVGVGDKTNEVGQFFPNAFGLYDMHGNVWEWCADDWHDNYVDAPTDGSAWINSNEEENINKENGSYSGKNDEKEPYPVLRGGSWSFNPNGCRSAARISFDRRDYRYFYIGFRVVCG